MPVYLVVVLDLSLEYHKATLALKHVPHGLLGPSAEDASNPSIHIVSPRPSGAQVVRIPKPVGVDGRR